MPIPLLPPEIISHIIRCAQPPHYSPISTKQTVFKQLALVAFTWYGFAKAEFSRWIDISFEEVLEEEKETFNIKTVGDLNNLARVRFARVMYPMEWEEEAVEIDTGNILSGCIGLEELWYYDDHEGYDGDDCRPLKLLSFLRSFPELHSLHLSFIPHPFGSTSHQLAALRHLSLDLFQGGIARSGHVTSSSGGFGFLCPQYLPSLVSLALTGLDLNTDSFLLSFFQCAAQIRFLYLHDHTQMALPTSLAVECTNLAHLCVIISGEELHPLLTTLTKRRLSSFTIRQYPGEVTSPLWEANLKEISDHSKSSLKNVQLYLLPELEQREYEEILSHSLALGVKWESMPILDMGCDEDIYYIQDWDELRLRLL